MICPAYHSYFILDVEETRNTFSLFGSDSLPKHRWEVDKEKYGIAKEVSDHKKMEDMRTISMNSIYNKIEDPFEMFRRDFAESDSLMIIDSTAVMAQSQGYSDFQNIDQMIYLHHFGKYLPRRGGVDDAIKEDLMVEEPLIPDVEDEVLPRKKKKLWPFGKKDKKSKEENSDDTQQNE